MVFDCVELLNPLNNYWLVLGVTQLLRAWKTCFPSSAGKSREVAIGLTVENRHQKERERLHEAHYRTCRVFTRLPDHKRRIFLSQNFRHTFTAILLINSKFKRCFRMFILFISAIYQNNMSRKIQDISNIILDLRICSA